MKWMGLGVLAGLLTAGAPQTTSAQQGEAAQLAFGYRCADQFALTNEGSRAVTVKYAVLGTSQHGSVTVQPSETADIVSRGPQDVQISVGGQVVATEPKGVSACASRDDNRVIVRHRDQEVSSVILVESPPVIMERVVVEPVIIRQEPRWDVSPWVGGFILGSILHPRPSYHRGYYVESRPPSRARYDRAPSRRNDAGSRGRGRGRP